MRPIHDMTELAPDQVVYHSAFGFARIQGMQGDQVMLGWDPPGDSLPRVVSKASFGRVYLRCTPGGFFDRALKDPNGLQQLLQVEPVEGLYLLLSDTGPLRRDEVRDWVVRRSLLPADVFDRWWEAVVQVGSKDARLLFDGDRLSLSSVQGDRATDLPDDALQMPDISDADDGGIEDGLTSELVPADDAYRNGSGFSEDGPSFLTLGASMAAALAAAHAEGRKVNPTRHGWVIGKDGRIQFAESDGRDSPRSATELPSASADMFAAGVLLAEHLIGRPWPRSVPGERVLPFLRHIAPTLPPSALAPLASVLSPRIATRPSSSAAWLEQWRDAARVETERQSSAFDPHQRTRIGYDTHVGRMKVLHTQTNQDALYVATKGSQTLMVVCDGISTANTGSGDLAASLGAQVVASLWDQWLPRLAQGRPEDARTFLSHALRTANQAICEASLRLAGGRLEGRVPMGSTAVVAVAQGNRVSYAWLGDSRIYLLGPYGASQLTADANQAGERFVEWHLGRMSSWDASGFALVRYLGHFDEAGHAEPLPPAMGSVLLLPHERLLLCTDGITDYIADNAADAADVVLRAGIAGDVDDCARRLVELANRGGGGDNATVVIAAPV
jgi:serine/threonine protein phosphatase PrpC